MLLYPSIEGRSGEKIAMSEAKQKRTGLTLAQKAEVARWSDQGLKHEEIVRKIKAHNSSQVKKLKACTNRNAFGYPPILIIALLPAGRSGS